MKPLTANELRIGNYVVFYGHISDVLLLTSSMASVELLGRIEPDLSRTHDGIEYDLISPIPLTEEWLVKFGVFRIGETYGISFHNNRLSGVLSVIPDQYVGRWELYLGTIHICYVDYVHEIQNVWHAITGEELTIKD